MPGPDRDLAEIGAVLARVFDRHFDECAPEGVSRAEFVVEELEAFSAAVRAERPDIDELLAPLFDEMPAEEEVPLESDALFGLLSDLEAAAKCQGAERVAVMARLARDELVESEVGSIGWRADVPLVVLFRLRRLLHRLDGRLVEFWLRQMNLRDLVVRLRAVSVGEEKEVWPGPPARNGPGPTRLELLKGSALQPHAPPVRIFSAPPGESVVRLKQAREGLMAA